MARPKPGMSAKSEFNGTLGYGDGDDVDSRRNDDEKRATGGRTTLHRFLHGASILERDLTPVSSGQNEPRTGSVFLGSISPVHNFRFHSSTVKDKDAVELDEFARRVTVEDDGGGHIMRSGSVIDYGEDYGMKEHERLPYTLREPERSPGYPPGDFHFISSSRSQVKKTAEESHEFVPNVSQRSEVGNPDDFGAVPSRFHQGRESLSVIRNVTIRDETTKGKAIR